MVTGTLDLGTGDFFPDGEDEMSHDREDEKAEIGIEGTALGHEPKPWRGTDEERDMAAAHYKGVQGLTGGPVGGPLPHDRLYFLALGFMSYIMDGEARPSDVEMLADLMRQEVLR